MKITYYAYLLKTKTGVKTKFLIFCGEVNFTMLFDCYNIPPIKAYTYLISNFKYIFLSIKLFLHILSRQKNVCLVYYNVFWRQIRGQQALKRYIWSIYVAFCKCPLRILLIKVSLNILSRYIKMRVSSIMTSFGGKLGVREPLHNIIGSFKLLFTNALYESFRLRYYTTYFVNT